MKVRIKDIAERAGVSTGTVDRILHNRGNVSEAAREAVANILKEVNYKPNIHISGMSLKRTYRIIITTHTIFPGEYWESIHRGIDKALVEYDNIKIDLLIYRYNQYDIYSCRDVYSRIAAMEADGVIIGPTFEEETIKLATELESKSIPYIFVDSMMQGTSPLAYFSSDHYTCGYLMCKLLTSITPENSEIGILQAERIGDGSANTTILRKKGINDYLNEKGLSNKLHRIPFSVLEPRRTELLLSKFFHTYKNIGGIVVPNSRGSVIADYFAKNGIKNIRLVCVDVTEPNAKALKEGYIDFLIGQQPERQGFMAIKTLIEYLVYRNPVKVDNFVPLDILTKETIEYYETI
jgi:LacI family transcriptional regulator